MRGINVLRGYPFTAFSYVTSPYFFFFHLSKFKINFSVEEGKTHLFLTPLSHLVNIDAYPSHLPISLLNSPYSSPFLSLPYEEPPLR